MAKIIKKVTLNAPASTSTTSTSSGHTGVDPTKGTQENPYTWDEFEYLFCSWLWNGGWVEGIGYISADIYGSLFSDSDSFHSGWWWPEDEAGGNNNGNQGNGGNQNSQNGNQGNSNTNGGSNNGGGNNGGNNGNGQTNGNNDITNFRPEWDPQKYMCFYKCLQSSYYGLYRDYIKNSLIPLCTAELFGNIYCDGIANSNFSWSGSHDSIDRIAPHLYTENNEVNPNLLLFLQAFFSTSGWVYDTETIKDWLRTSSTYYYGSVIGIIDKGSGMKHAVLLRFYDSTENKYWYFAPVEGKGNTIAVNYVTMAIKLYAKQLIDD